MRVPDLWSSGTPLHRTGSKGRVGSGYVLVPETTSPKLFSPRQQGSSALLSSFAEPYAALPVQQYQGAQAPLPCSNTNSGSLTARRASQSPQARRLRSMPLAPSTSVGSEYREASPASPAVSRDGADSACCAAYLYMRENDSSQFDSQVPLQSLRTLDLSINGIVSCEFLWDIGPTNLPITRFPSLRHLYLTGNSLVSLHGLSGLPSLETLTLSSNQIRTLEGLNRLDSLRILSLHHNDIESMKGFPCLPSLTAINLVGNPVAERPGYRKMVLAMASPDKVDNRSVAEDERVAAQKWRGMITFAMKEGFLPDIGTNKASNERLAVDFMNRTQRRCTESLELLTMRITEKRSGASTPFKPKGSAASIQEGLPLCLSVTLVDRRRTSSEGPPLVPFHNPCLPPVEFKVEGTAEAVHLSTGLNDYSPLIDMSVQGVSPGQDVGAPSESCFATTLYTTPGESLYRYVVDDEIVCDEPLIEGPDGGQYTHLYVPPSAVSPDDAQAEMEDIIHIRWLASTDEQGWEAIPGAETPEFTPTHAEVGRFLRAETLVYCKGWFQKLFYTITDEVVAGPPSVGSLAIRGDPYVGETLSLEVAYVGGSEGESTVFWYRRKNGNSKRIAMPSPSCTTYTLRCEDVDHSIAVVYTPRRADGLVGASSEATLATPVLRTPPTLEDLRFTSDVAIVGHPMQVTGVFAGGEEGSHIYEWRNPVTGAQKSCRSNVIIPEEFDAGYQLQVRVTPVSSEGRRGRTIVMMSPTVVYGEPELHGVELVGLCEEGKTLRLNYTFVGGREGQHAIEWSSSRGSSVSKERSYKLTLSDIGSRVSCTATPMRCDGLAGKAVTVTSPVIVSARPSAKVKIAGAPYTGETLSLDVQYLGGVQGRCFVSWGRIHLKDASPLTLAGSLRGPECEWAEDTTEMKRVVTEEDIGCVIAARYTPVREDGMQGTTVVAKSTVIGPVVHEAVGVAGVAGSPDREKSASGPGGHRRSCSGSESPRYFSKPLRSNSTPAGTFAPPFKSMSIALPEEVVEFDQFRASDFFNLNVDFLAHAGYQWETTTQAGRTRVVGESDSYFVTRADVGKTITLSIYLPNQSSPITGTSGVVSQAITRFGVATGQRMLWSDQSVSPTSSEMAIGTRLEAKWIVQNKDVKVECFWETFADSKWSTVSKKEHFTPSARELGLRLRVVAVPVVLINALHERGTRVVHELRPMRSRNGEPSKGTPRLSSSMKVSSSPRAVSTSPKLASTWKSRPVSPTLLLPQPDDFPKEQSRKPEKSSPKAALPPEAKRPPKASTGSLASPRKPRMKKRNSLPVAVRQQSNSTDSGVVQGDLGSFSGIHDASETTGVNGITPDTSPAETRSDCSDEAHNRQSVASSRSASGYNTDDSDVNPLPRMSKRAALAARALRSSPLPSDETASPRSADTPQVSLHLPTPDGDAQHDDHPDDDLGVIRVDSPELGRADSPTTATQSPQESPETDPIVIHCNSPRRDAGDAAEDAPDTTTTTTTTTGPNGTPVTRAAPPPVLNLSSLPERPKLPDPLGSPVPAVRPSAEQPEPQPMQFTITVDSGTPLHQASEAPCGIPLPQLTLTSETPRDLGRSTSVLSTVSGRNVSEVLNVTQPMEAAAFVLSVSSYDSSDLPTAEDAGGGTSSSPAESPTQVSTITLPIVEIDAIPEVAELGSPGSPESPKTPVSLARRSSRGGAASPRNSLLGGGGGGGGGGASDPLTPRGTRRARSGSAFGGGGGAAPFQRQTTFDAPVSTPRGGHSSTHSSPRGGAPVDRGASGTFARPVDPTSLGRRRSGAGGGGGSLLLAIPGSPEAGGGGGAQSVKAKRTRSATFTVRKPNLPSLNLTPGGASPEGPSTPRAGLSADESADGELSPSMLSVPSGGRRHRSATMMRPSAPASPVSPGGLDAPRTPRRRTNSFLAKTMSPVASDSKARRLSVANTPSPRQRSGTFRPPSFEGGAAEAANIIFTTLTFPLGSRAEVATATPLLSHYSGNGAEGRSSFVWQKRFGGEGTGRGWR